MAVADFVLVGVGNGAVLVKVLVDQVGPNKELTLGEDR